jgi:predicted phosphodiesterase
MEELKPLIGETVEQFMYRLSDNKNELNLSWKDISILICTNFGRKVSSDYVRHEYYAMKKRDKIEVDKEEGYTKVMVVNDLHVPYHREDFFNELEKNKDIDYLIINGDLADCKSCSFFDDFDKPSVEEELVILHEFLTKVNDIIDPAKTKIIANRGNHEYRYTRDIMRMHEKHLSKMLNPKLLSMLQDGFTVYEKNKNIIYKPIENFECIDDFYIRLFDNLIVAHPLDFSGVDGRMCEKVADYFLNEHIAEKDDVIIFGHTHKFSSMKVNRRQGVYVIENGCLCKPHEYSKMGKLSYTPQNYCYTVLKFKTGNKININDIKITHLD